MPTAGERHYRSRSLWLDTVPDPLDPRPGLTGSTAVDVAIIGAGYTGLWTAYELLGRDPSLRVAVLEAEIAGFGASGRNGGWCSALFAGNRSRLAAIHGRGAVVDLLATMRATVREVGEICARESIDAHYHRGGTLTVATNGPQVERLRREVEHERAWGAADDDARWLDQREVRNIVHVPAARGAMFTPHCARIHPARLARGLADVVERMGAAIYERTRVSSVSPRRLVTDGGTIAADVIVRATEGYTARLPALRRRLVPLYSLMIATEPMSDAHWDAIGLADAPTFADGRNLIVYGQRTADGRIAFGGRGAPYHYASRVADRFDRDRSVFDALRTALHELLPGTVDATITHQWGGPLGVPRDWTSGVGFDRVTGEGWAGGYVGDGVGTTRLAGATLADLILGEDTPRTRLPWVGHRSRDWEPEPLRWLGINAGLRLPAVVDAAEARRGRTPRMASAMLRRLAG